MILNKKVEKKIKNKKKIKLGLNFENYKKILN